MASAQEQSVIDDMKKVADTLNCPLPSIDLEGRISAAIHKRYGVSARQFQLDAVKNVVAGVDVCVLADTGQGKSLCYGIVPDMLGEESIVLVISPLKSICRDQVASLNERKLRAIHVEDSKQITPALLRGDYSFIFISPEMFLEKAFKEMLLSPVYQSRLKLVAVDEADCVAWSSFRRCWDAVFIGKIRAFLPDSCTFMALTATMSHSQSAVARLKGLE